MAEGLSPSSEYRRDDDEFIEVLRVPLSALPGMIANATIIDAKTICLVCRCFG
jgi:ADP-ribose pyrophosphatase